MMNSLRLLALGILIAPGAFGQGSSATDPTFYSIVFGVANFAALPDCTGTTGSPPRNKTQHRYVIDEGHKGYQCRDDGGTFGWAAVSGLGATAQEHFITEVTLPDTGDKMSIVAHAAMIDEPVFRLCPPGGCDPAPPLVSVLADGKVGIGIAVPLEKFHLVDNIRLSGSVRTDLGTTSTTWFSNVGAAVLGRGAVSTIDIGNNSFWQQIDFYTSALLRLSITDTGVGINETSPTAHLHLSCGVTGDCFKVDAFGGPNSLFISNDGDVGLGTDIPQANLHIFDEDAAAMAIFFGSPSDTLGARIQYQSGTQLMTIGPSSPFVDLQFTAGNNVQVMRLLDTGDVGIGTASPTEALDIDSGKIRLRQDCNPTPTASSDTGVIGEFCFGSDDRIYRHNGTDWVRSAVLTTF